MPRRCIDRLSLITPVNSNRYLDKNVMRKSETTFSTCRLRHCGRTVRIGRCLKLEFSAILTELSLTVNACSWLCQKHRSCRQDPPSPCSGCHRRETKLIVRPCGETRWPHASPPRIITGRSSKNRFPFWSWLAAAATARTPAPFMDQADRRWYTLQHSCWMVQGSSSWPLWVDATDLCYLRDLMMMMMMIAECSAVNVRKWSEPLLNVRSSSITCTMLTYRPIALQYAPVAVY